LGVNLRKSGDLYLIAVSVKDYDELSVTLSKRIEASLPFIKSSVNGILQLIANSTKASV
jgi:hypothetical protein